MLLIDWIRPKLNPDVEIFCDLQLAGTRHVSELFNHFKPDLVLKNSKKVGLLELTGASIHERTYLTHNESIASEIHVDEKLYLRRLKEI